MFNSKHDFDRIPQRIRDKILYLFDILDKDHNGSIDKNETLKFWQNNMPNLNTLEVFCDVDKNDDQIISKEEWIEYWINKIYLNSEEDIESRVK